MVDQPAGESFDIGVIEQNGVVVISVHGSLDLATAPRLAGTAYPTARGADRGLVLDLSGVRFLSSSGVSVVLRTIELTPPGAGAVMVAPHRAVRHPMTLAGLDETITITDDLPSAIDAVSDITQTTPPPA